METENITSKIKQWLILGFLIPVISGAAIGYGAFNHKHPVTEIRIGDAKVTGTMISVRTLVDGKVSEFLFNDGDEVESGDVIARLEVDVNEETIAQLANTVELAKENLENLKKGQIVKVPVKKVKVIPPKNNSAASSGKSASLKSLEERANRMKDLFEMGAVSKKQMEAAVAAYENAKRNAPSSPAAHSEATYVEEITYVDQWQPTPAPVMQNAENALKQAELSLKVAQQQAQETEVIAPISGTIYYTAEADNDIMAGNSIAKIGDSKELWLTAEVTEDVFNQIKLGLPVNYILDGQNLSGTVIEKIEPDVPEVEENTEPVSKWIPPTEDNPHPEYTTADIEIKVEEPLNEKYFLKFSMPADFQCAPNLTTDVKISLYQ